MSSTRESPEPLLRSSASSASLATQCNHPLESSTSARRALETTLKSPAQPGIRSRKSSVVVDLDFSQPLLRRLNTDSSDKARTSFDELIRTPTEEEPQREVIVHQLHKNDTIASISLQYGITPQALRLSNRLWANDPIFLRRFLNIPLDQCHLPSSSSIERASREADGNLIVWERDRTTPCSRQGSSSDLLNPFATNGPRSSRSSLDSFREPSFKTRSEGGDYSGKGKAPALLIDGNELEEMDDAVSTYLPSTNNPYSFSAPPSPPLPSEFFSSYSPFASTSQTTQSRNSLTLEIGADIHSGPSSSTDSLDSRSYNSSTSATSPYAPYKPPSLLNKRTLTVERVPSSTLSFFPPPKPSFSNTSSTRTSSEEPYLDSPMTESINKKSLSASRKASKDESTLRAMFKISPASNRTTLLPSSLPSISNGGVRSGEKPGEKKESWYSKWDIYNFGAEEGGEFELAQKSTMR